MNEAKAHRAHEQAPAIPRSAVLAEGRRPKPGVFRTPALEEEIRRRAYEIFLERGGEHGRDLEDWLRAEREVVSR
jgi:hypothetical protein